MKYITKEILKAYDNSEENSGNQLTNAFKNYEYDRIGFLKNASLSGECQALLNYHFHDCEVLELSYDQKKRVVTLKIDGGLKPYDDAEHVAKLNVDYIEFYESTLDSEIDIPFVSNTENKYVYIYGDEFSYDEEARRCQFSFITSDDNEMFRSEVAIQFRSMRVFENLV